jgi:hypothetical protein
MSDTAETMGQPQAAATPNATAAKKGDQRRKRPKLRLVKKATRERSRIEFPYVDLEAALTIAQAMMNAGGVALTREQLAGVTGLALGSGNFVLKCAAARMFGFMAGAQGKHELTALGFDAVGSDERTRRAARARAFLTVPLYKKVYDEFRGKSLPPRPRGLEQAFVHFGVAEKSADNARLAFDKSARQAGYFDNGDERLVEPIIDRMRPLTDAAGEGENPGGASPSRARRLLDQLKEDEDNDLHPFIQGLLDTLPAPNTLWTVEGRGKWLQAAANIFDLLYTGDGTISILVRGHE